MTKACGHIIILTRLFVLVCPLLGGCLVLVRPTSPELWSSLHSCPAAMSWTAKLSLAFLQSYLIFIPCDVGLVWVSSTFPFLFFILDVLNFMRYRKNYFTNTVDLFYHLWVILIVCRNCPNQHPMPVNYRANISKCRRRAKLVRCRLWYIKW